MADKAAAQNKIFTMPAGADFLAALAHGLAAESGLKDNPEALADALIYVPNRRSERALAFAIHQAAGGKACLLPSIRALGDLDSDDPPPSAEAAFARLPPALEATERLGALTRMVKRYFDAISPGMPAVACLSAARELARLLDQAALSGEVDWSGLQHLAPNAQLAEHWQQAVKFLQIITAHWPAHLEQATRMDPFVRRAAAAKAMAEHWQDQPPQTPVIIAGSTGATPASRILMQAAMQLPTGRVILPGLDTEVDPATLAQIVETPSHPQFALLRTLKALGLTPGSVALWPGLSACPEQNARRLLLHQALTPAQRTSDWTLKLAALAPHRDAPTFVRQALDGLTLIEASDDIEEAQLAALLMRETLEHETQTAALVTPDASLARQVSALLKRWQVNVPPSAGRPLSQTDAGSFVLLVAAWMADPAHPVHLMAVLNHAICKIDQDLARYLDQYVLRGPRTWTDLAELAKVTSAHERSAHQEEPTHLSDLKREALTFLETLDLTFAKMDLPETAVVSGQSWLHAVVDLAQHMGRAPHPWSGDDGAAMSALMRDLAHLAGPMGDQPGQVWFDLLEAEARQISIAAGLPHPRLAIWGPLEARLQSADRVILAGLNEDVWPAQPLADAFVPRVFREKIGLSDPDERIGLAAHDFTQLAAVPNVTLLTSKRRNDKPAIASRWLWRLKTLARGALGEAAKEALAAPRDRDPVAWLRALETAPDLPDGFTSEPRPTPPISARPTRLSVTRIERLIRDPYAIYCESILKLRPLDSLDAPTDARLRGVAIHKALERFENTSAHKRPDDLLDLVEAELRKGGESEADLIALRERRRDVCAEYLSWRDRVATEIESDPMTEIVGQYRFSVRGTPFTLTSTADRLERRANGHLAILDFKTGRPPSEKQVRAGLNPQMPLQGLIAREGGYAALGRRQVDALTYVRFGTQFDVRSLGAAVPRSKIDARSVPDLIADAEAGLERLLLAFASPDHPYLSAPRPERVAHESDYSRLARRAEWTGLETYD